MVIERLRINIVKMLMSFKLVSQCNSSGLDEILRKTSVYVNPIFLTQEFFDSDNNLYTYINLTIKKLQQCEFNLLYWFTLYLF